MLCIVVAAVLGREVTGARMTSLSAWTDVGDMVFLFTAVLVVDGDEVEGVVTCSLLEREPVVVFALTGVYRGRSGSS